MKTQPSYYSILTANIRYNKDFSDFEKILFSDITALTNKNGYCSATNNYFAQIFGKRPETISRSISKLEKKGFLKILLIREGKQIKERRIFIKADPTIDENVNTPIDENVNTPIDENVKGNNTSNNTINLESKRKILFKNSKFINKQSVIQQFLKMKEPDRKQYGGAYIPYYIQVVNEWSEAKDVKRTDRGWFATIKQFIRRDKENDKLMTKAIFEKKFSKKIDRSNSNLL